MDMAHHHQPIPLTPSLNNTPCHDDQPIHDSILNFNVAVIIAAVICALLCALGLNTMLHCVLQCTYRTFTQPIEWFASHQMNSGLKKKEVVALPTSTYSSSPSQVSSCCAICLLEFADGEEIRVLPECNHRFHVGCIDKWLLSNSSCPTCRLHLKTSSCAASCLQIVTTAL